MCNTNDWEVLVTLFQFCPHVDFNGRKCVAHCRIRSNANIWIWNDVVITEIAKLFVLPVFDAILDIRHEVVH